MRGSAAACLLTAGLAWQAASTGAVAQGGGPSKGAPAPVATTTSAASLRDDFSASSWGTGSFADHAVEYADEALHFTVVRKNYFTWSTPNGESYENVRMEFTARNNGTDPTTAFGVMCNKDPEVDNFHYLVLTPAGEYAIAKAVAGQDDLFLTNNDRWASSEKIATNADFYRVAAECGNGRLSLLVDGREIASVEDSTYRSGEVGIVVWSGQEAEKTDMSFDDFILTGLD